MYDAVWTVEFVDQLVAAPAPKVIEYLAHNLLIALLLTLAAGLVFILILVLVLILIIGCLRMNLRSRPTLLYCKCESTAQSSDEAGFHYFPHVSFSRPCTLSSDQWHRGSVLNTGVDRFIWMTHCL